MRLVNRSGDLSSNRACRTNSLRKAQHLFDEAIQKDPNFALAYSGLGDTYIYLAFTGAMQKEHACQAAKDELAEAMALDDGIGEASCPLYRCPKCGGPMKVIERFTAGDLQLRSPPQVDAA